MSPETSVVTQYGAIGFMLVILMGVFSYLVKRMLDHVLQQHAAYASEKFSDMKRSIENFGERLGRVEQELAAFQAIEKFTRRITLPGPGDVK